MLTSNICDGAYLVVEAYSFIIKWTQSQMFSKILLQMNYCTKPSLVWVVFTKLGWFWVVACIITNAKQHNYLANRKSYRTNLFIDEL